MQRLPTLLKLPGFSQFPHQQPAIYSSTGTNSTVAPGQQPRILALDRPVAKQHAGRPTDPLMIAAPGLRMGEDRRVVRPPGSEAAVASLVARSNQALCTGAVCLLPSNLFDCPRAALWILQCPESLSDLFSVGRPSPGGDALGELVLDVEKNPSEADGNARVCDQSIPEILFVTAIVNRAFR